jgi:hypothetical protein
MNPIRVESQLKLALSKGDDCINYLIGTNFNRIPVDSTPYYTDCLNSLNDQELYNQRFRECTIICPTWFYHRNVFDKVALTCFNSNSIGFVESSANLSYKLSRIPEDAFFFMEHLKIGGKIAKVNDILTTYRYTIGSWALSTPKLDLQRVRINYLEYWIRNNWKQYSIWGYGKDAKKVFNMLSNDQKQNLVAFHDVDTNKVGRLYYCKDLKRHFSVLSHLEIKPPFIVLVGSKRYHGALETNILSLGFVEGVDYLHFC